VLVDYGSGNVRSLRAALERAGGRCELSSDPDTVRRARVLVVPGQGAAASAMRTLSQRGLASALNDAVTAGAYLLGVCIGLQLLFEYSDEDATACLGFLPGRVERLTGARRLPHMGWNDVAAARGASHPFAAALPACAYFAHSYGVLDAGEATIATTDIDGVGFAAIVAHERIAAMQFHPERSGPFGLSLLRSYLRLADAA
jgi:imidazole glycerol-phosphate synthase subunit HisH